MGLGRQSELFGIFHVFSKLPREGCRYTYHGMIRCREFATDAGSRAMRSPIIKLLGVMKMTEKVGFGKGLGPIGSLSVPRKAANLKSASDKSSTDRVEFSSVLQEVSKAQGVQETAAAARTQKLAALKEQIASGTYRPDLDKVAASLVKFMDGED